jgi:hypothetical protein
MNRFPFTQFRFGLTQNEEKRKEELEKQREIEKERKKKREFAALIVKLEQLRRLRVKRKLAEGHSPSHNHTKKLFW